MAAVGMSEQQLIALRFQRAVKYYRQHAVVQQAMASDLLQLAMPEIQAYQAANSAEDLAANSSALHRLNLLEIGCGVGLLTQQLCRYLPINHYIANDLYADAADAVLPIFQQYRIQHDFLCGDACDLVLSERQDVIAGGAVLQWINDVPRLFKHLHALLKPHGVLLLSGFTSENYHEIKSITGRGLSYHDLAALQSAFEPFFSLQAIDEQRQTLYFDSPQAVLQHIKNTGVNAVGAVHWKKSDLQYFITAYEAFKTDKGYPLTYTPQLFVFRRIS